LRSAQDDRVFVEWLKAVQLGSKATADSCGMTTKKQGQQQGQKQIPFGDDNKKGDGKCHKGNGSGVICR
jgi:hypothetical protein